ncbi:hypothetical protein CANCADRAFT_20657, partial [Tortispora caseinolytica NRRL Y-17796]
RHSIGDWTFTQNVGAGSMGKVKLAINSETGEYSAVKIVPRISKKSNSQDPNKDLRTMREAAISSLLHHPHICNLRQLFLMTNHYYLVFEYVNGGQMLDYIITHGRLKEKQARRFARQIVSAVEYCHRNSVVHRDLKIENILISATGDIKIIDFGLSNLYSPQSLLNTFCGSLYFAAPELLNARRYVGPEVDIWSFGVVLYVLVCGRVPFDDQSMSALRGKIRNCEIEYPVWLSPSCKDLLCRILVVNPHNRATMAQIFEHPWMNKGYTEPIDVYMPNRTPLSLPLDDNVIQSMAEFEFGDAKTIKSDLTRILSSPEYQESCNIWRRIKEKNERNGPSTVPTGSSSDYLDPTRAYDPLISLYYLVRERLDRTK